MNTLVVTLEFPPESDNGIANWAHDLARAHHESGHTVRVLAKKTSGCEVYDARQPYAVHRIRGRSWGRWQAWWARLAGSTLLEEHDRVVFSTWRMASRLGPLAHRQGCKIGVAAHGSELTRMHRSTREFERVDRITDCWLPVSSFLASELSRLGARRPIRVLPMPIATEGTPLPHSERSGLVMLARLTPLKGLERAVALARALGEPLTVIGEGPARTTVEVQSGTEIRFLGRLERADSMQIVRAARALVLLPETAADGTGSEGLGLCLLEAATQGVPGIGCATGGVPEALGPGLLIDPEKPDLAKVRAFLDDPDRGENSRKWVRHHHGPARCLEELDEALS